MRKIAVVTGSRAEYGLLKPLIAAIEGHKSIHLSLLVTGMHLIPEYGNTYEEIERDGFAIAAKVEDGLIGDTSVAISTSVGKALAGFATVYEQIRPDIVVVLGDRSEILAAAAAAMFAAIPIVHLHGGETTEGAYDEFIRHAITKMSYLHFTSCEVYRRRIIQMGEDPKRVFNVGAIGIDSIRQLQLLDKRSFERSISKDLDKNAVLITFHPVTLENATAGKQFGELLEALDTLQDTTLIFTKPNSDKDGHIIIEMIDNYIGLYPKKTVCFSSLGQLRYLSALRHVNYVIGNSSSGIIEVPYFKIPTINIGDRQKGRLAPCSVINCPPDTSSILGAMKMARSKKFLASIQTQDNLYGDGYTTPKIVGKLKHFDFFNTQKTFYDLNQDNYEKL